MKLTKFTPISKEILKQNGVYPFHIYKEVEEKVFSVLLKQGEAFLKSKACFSVDENYATTLYVKAEQKHLYFKFLEENINDFLNNKSINLDSKAEMINQIASSTMNDLFKKEIQPDNVEHVDEIVDNTVKLILKDTKAMYSMLKVTSYDYYTYTHCVDVAAYAIGFGVFLGLDEDQLNILGKAAMLHDIGKKNIPHEIITKNGRLTYEEFEIVKQHPVLSVKILKEIGEENTQLLEIIAQHHEKCNGTGYPRGLKANEIHDLAKIVSICDIFNALTTRRTYKDRMSSFDAFAIMYQTMKDELCPTFLRKFVKFMGYNENIDEKSILLEALA
jgi:putative nucleotidyltransferase with HDIG domain